MGNGTLKKYFFDSETCGKYGIPVLFQYAIDDGPIRLVDIFDTPFSELKRLIEDMMDNCFICHNINFDHQMVQKLYNMICYLETMKHPYGWLSEVPLACLIDAEYESRKGKCLKPRAAVDTMILSAKSDGQSALMAAKPIFIRRVPIEYGEALADELTDRTDLPWILFARSKTHKYAKWIVSERKDEETGEVDPNFVDVQLKFKPSNGLKDLHQYLFDSETTKFEDIMPDEFPGGPGYCPYVAPLAGICDENWLVEEKKSDKVVRYKLWPALIDEHVEFWRTNEEARKYASFDITMLRDLYEHFGAPENDSDSVLACQIASVRLYGFKLNLEKMKEMREESAEFVANAPINVNSPKQVKSYIAEVLDPMEQLMVARGCNAEKLEKIVKQFTLDEKEDCECEVDQRLCKRCGGKGVVGPDPCPDCDGDDEDCETCKGTGLINREMEAAKRALLIEEVRTHKKRVELFDKLLLAGRAYPNFRAVGTKSGRLSGTDGLNFQGVEASIDVRNLFELTDEGEVLSGGDYDGQEVAIAGTTMNDDALLEDMKKGKKIHGLFAAELFETTYEDILENKDEPNSRYGRGKSAVFLTIYGGTYFTMAQRAGVEVEIAERAFNAFVAKYPGVGATKKMINDRFQTIHRTDEGKMEYREPSKKYIESIFGFRRYFNTEFYIQRLLFDLCGEIFDREKETTPFIEKLRDDERLVTRDTKNFREQKMGAAMASALIGACYSVGNGIIRAANNHLIQSAGRTITVGLQENLWNLQPQGIHDFVIRPMSVHDEVAAVSSEDLVEEVTDVVRTTLDKQCELIPLLQMDWGRHLPSWGEMKKVSTKTHDAVHVGIDL